MQILVVANDRLATRLVRFLQSVQTFAKSVRITIVPFDESFQLCARIATAFSGEDLSIAVYDDNNVLNQIDDFGHKLFDDNVPQQPYPYMLGKLRKLVMFTLFEPCLYMDIDIILTNDFSVIIDFLEVADFGLAYYVKSIDWVYNSNGPLGKSLRQKSNLFSSGFLSRGRDTPNLESVIALLQGDRSLFHDVRAKGVVDQPLLNFIADRLNVNVMNLQKKLDLSESVTPNDDIVVRSDWTAWRGTKPVPFIHAAGHFKEDRRCRFLFDAMYLSGLQTIRGRDSQLYRDLLEKFSVI